MAKLCWLVDQIVVQWFYRVYIYMYRRGEFELKNYIKFFSLLLVFTIVFSNLAFASSFADYDESGQATTIQSDEIVSKVEDGVTEVATTVNSLAYTIIEQISDKSLPVCGLLILWGAINYFILGIRNLYKKKQGLILMFSSMTFYVLIVIINFVLTYALSS